MHHLSLSMAFFPYTCRSLCSLCQGWEEVTILKKAFSSPPQAHPPSFLSFHRWPTPLAVPLTLLSQAAPWQCFLWYWSVADTFLSLSFLIVYLLYLVSWLVALPLFCVCFYEWAKWVPPLHTEGSWHPEVTGGIAVALVNAAWEQLILSLRGELLLTAAPTSLSWHRAAFCAPGLRLGNGKQKVVFLLSK